MQQATCGAGFSNLLLSAYLYITTWLRVGLENFDGSLSAYIILIQPQHHQINNAARTADSLGNMIANLQT